MGGNYSEMPNGAKLILYGHDKSTVVPSTVVPSLRRRDRHRDGVCIWADLKQGDRLLECEASVVGWDQRRFAAPAHHRDGRFPSGGPALEASLSHPTLNKVVAW